MHSSHCPCSRTYIKTTVWTSKIKLHLPVWDTLITPMSVGIQSKTKLCPTKTAPLISSPIKSISCPRAYFRRFISPVVSGNRPYPGLPSQKARRDVCLSGVLYRGLMLLSAPRPFPMIIQDLPLAFPIFTAGSTFCVHPEQNEMGSAFRKLLHLFFFFFSYLAVLNRWAILQRGTEKWHRCNTDPSGRSIARIVLGFIHLLKKDRPPDKYSCI